MSLFFIIFFTVYSLANFYIGLRGWQSLALYPSIRPIYLVLFLYFTLAYLVAKIFHKYLPTMLYEILNDTGSFWFACMLYFFLIVVGLDFIRLINKFFSLYPHVNYNNLKFMVFAGSFVLVSGLLLYGYINSRSFKVNTVEITLPKKNSKLSSLNIVQISDIHLSSLNNEKFLAKAVNMINDLNPDIVLIPGDLVDEGAQYLQEKNLGISFTNIKAKYGIYASTGNHEYINGGHTIINYMKTVDLNWILDDAVLVDESFYLIGRLDTSKRSFTGEGRKTLKSIKERINDDYPVILLDHTPFKLNEAEEVDIDLQLSGHTHHGQMFPANLITKMIYEKSWGYHKKSNTHYYVSSGLGTWGPPIKIGNDAEIVNIKVKFE